MSNEEIQVLVCPLKNDIGTDISMFKYYNFTNFVIYAIVTSHTQSKM